MKKNQILVKADKNLFERVLKLQEDIVFLNLLHKECFSSLQISQTIISVMHTAPNTKSTKFW